MKIFVLDHNSVLKDIKKEFEVVDRIEDCDKVVLWNDVNPLERGIIRMARNLGKKSVVVQHGRKGSARYYPPFDEKITADKLLVWGEFDRQSLITAGQDPKKMQVVGSPVFKSLKPKEDHEGVNVVFCPEHWDRPVDENWQVRDKLRKLKGVNVITKIIESHEPSRFDNPIISERDSDNHLETCAEVLKTADLVVGVSESTFELLAQAMDIPVVIMEEWEPKAFGGDMRYLTYRRVISRAAKRANIKNLLEVIKDQLANPKELQAERKAVCVEEGGINLNANEEIKKAILTL